MYSFSKKVIDALGQPIKVSAESGGRRVFQIKYSLRFRFLNLFSHFKWLRFLIRLK